MYNNYLMGQGYPNGYNLGNMQQTAQPPRQEVIKVNGENGARAYPMGANSSALLLDESGAYVWLVMTDGAGYKTVAPYDITPHQTVSAPDITALESRITNLEAIINGITADFTATERSNTTGSSDAAGNKPTSTADHKPDTRFNARR